MRLCRKTYLSRLLRLKVVAFIAFFAVFIPLKSHAQLSGLPTLAASPAAQTSKNSNMLVDANQLIYNHDEQTVNLDGKVHIYYDGRVLEADKVVYNRQTKRMKAFGNVRMTDQSGNKVTGSHFDIDDKFTDGFIAGLNLETPDRIFIGAANGTRTAGSTTTFEKSTYTACEPCDKNPKKNPLWQIKATKVVHKEKEKTIYFHHARLEFLGVPLVYIPYFWIPDQSEKRKSGFLSPNFFSSNRLGYGIETPYYHVFSPNHDATFSPTYYMKQGFLLKGEHRIAGDSYSNTILGAIINQKNPLDFAQNSGAYPYIETPGSKTTRYVVNVKGQYRFSPNWVANWDVTHFSDRLFMRDYNLSVAGQTEANSTVSLTGTGLRSYFDVRMVRYQGLAIGDRQVEIPDTAQLDYFKSFGKVLGGELSFRANAAIVNRDQADFDARTTRTLFDPVYARNYDGCDSMTPASVTPTSNNRFDCLLRGMPGNYTRASVEAQWRKKIIDSVGQVWEPFATAKADMAFLALRPNLDVTNYLGIALNPNTNVMRIMPTVGLTYRFPFVAQASILHSTLEPIVQFVARPNEHAVGRLPNEDAQSLVFDDSNLFQANKFSGWDRNEGGGRLNYGLNYTGRFSNGAYFNVLFGQSQALFGINSFIYGNPNNFTGNIDPSGAGANSGLDTQRSDYVARLQIRPNDMFQISSRFRIDRATHRIMRNETDVSFLYKRLSLVGTYALFAERPLLGFDTIRQGVGGAAAYKIDENWTSFASGRYDLDMNRFDGVTAGLNYLDECYQFGLFYSRVFYYGAAGAVKPPDDHRFMIRMGFRTVGELNASRTILQ